MTEKPASLPPIPFPQVQFDNSNETPKLDSKGNIKADQEDLEELKRLISQESEYTRHLGMIEVEYNKMKNLWLSKASDACRSREDFCYRMKKKYSIPDGVKWDADFEHGIIKLDKI